MRRKLLITLVALIVVALTVSYVLERRGRRAEALDRVDLAFDALEDIFFDYGLEVVKQDYTFEDRTLRDVVIALAPRSGDASRYVFEAREIRLLELETDDLHDVPIRIELTGSDLLILADGLEIPFETLDLDYAFDDEIFDVGGLSLRSRTLGEVTASFAASGLDEDLVDWVWSRADLRIALSKRAATLWRLTDGGCERIRDALSEWEALVAALQPLFAQLEATNCRFSDVSVRVNPPAPISLDEAASDGQPAAFDEAMGFAFSVR